MLIKITIILLLFYPLFVSTQVFSSLITGFMVRTNEVYECQPGSYFKTINRSSLIRSYRPDCNPVKVEGEGRNKYQVANWNGRQGLLDADVTRVFNVKQNDAKFQMDYLQNGQIIEKTSFSECDGDLLSNDQAYLYDISDCTKEYLYLNSVKAYLHIEGKCQSVCWGNVILK